MKNRFKGTKSTLFVMAGVVGALAPGMLATSAYASANNTHHVAYSDVNSNTTLDACGYFHGFQTASKAYQETNKSGTTHYNEKGSWNGVFNQDGSLVIKGLGAVDGTYSENFFVKSDGDVQGVEHFNSSAGIISQQFAYSAASGWNVNVQATGALAFLTSNTNGNCYIGTYPRP